MPSFMKKTKFYKSYDYALKLLRFRDRTENEIEEKLTKIGVDKQIIEKIIERLKRYNLINDKKFVQNYIYKQIKKCKNIKLIIEELKNKFKVENEILNNVNIENFKKQLWENILSTIKSKYPDLNLQKIQNFLLSKGFDYTEIEELITLIKGRNYDNHR